MCIIVTQEPATVSTQNYPNRAYYLPISPPYYAVQELK